MSKEVLAVDVDEVLFPFMPQFVEFYNQRYDKQVKVGDFVSYNFEEILEIGQSEVSECIYTFHNMKDLHVQPVYESQKAIQHLREFYDLSIITARHPMFEDSTKAWLQDKYEGAFSRVVLIGHAAIMERPQTKAQVCKDIGAVALIDDSPSHHEKCVEENIGAVLFGEYGWNIDAKVSEGIVRCKDWPAVGEYFDGIS